MQTGPKHRFAATLAVVLAASISLCLAASAQMPGGGENLFADPSFEMGMAGWELQKGGSTVAQFGVDSRDAAAGKRSARVKIGAVSEWGAQFGQKMDAGEKGKTYTFAVLAKSVKGPVAVGLRIERCAKPWNQVAKSRRFTLSDDEWTELHVTFDIAKDFPQGWFAYISCTQPNAEYRADMFRLYEGEYVPFEQVAKEETASHGARLFDTRTSSSTPLSGNAMLKKIGWARLPEGQTTHAFKGDAVLMNSRLAVVLRKSGSGAEVYAGGRSRTAMRAVLRPLPVPTRQTGTAGGRAVKLSSVKIVENSAGETTIDASFAAADRRAFGLRCELKMGQVFVKTRPLGATEKLRVEAPCRFAVLPDFFADDIVADAAQIQVSRAELPSENFLLHMLGNGEALLMSVWSAREKDVQITLSGQGATRSIDASEIHYGKEGNAWVAIMEAKDIWHMREVAKKDAGRVLRLSWQMPYHAQWRVDWRRDDDLTDSWEMVAERRDGKYAKYGWFGSANTLPSNRKRWTTVLGRFLYPCWVNKRGRGYLQPLKKRLSFEGPAVIYPINRVKKTPLDRYTVVDIVRETLGVGPCEYILDVEAQQTSRKGRATCSTRDKLNAIYKKGTQKQKRAEIEKALTDVLIFVKHIRGRIEDYVAFGHEMLTYLGEQKEARPDLAGYLTEMEKLTREIDASVARRQEKIKTPAYVAALTDKFRKTLMDYQGRDALTKCKAITSAIVVVGGNQDELVGECRMAVKRLRQRAGLAAATDPKAATVAREIRARTRKMLRNPTSYEAPRH